MWFTFKTGSNLISIRCVSQPHIFHFRTNIQSYILCTTKWKFPMKIKYCDLKVCWSTCISLDLNKTEKCQVCFKIWFHRIFVLFLSKTANVKLFKCTLIQKCCSGEFIHKQHINYFLWNKYIGGKDVHLLYFGE